MPELPEVETIRRGLEPGLVGQKAVAVIVRNPHLRWKVPLDLESFLSGKTLQKISRRAKYLLFDFEEGFLLIHLGMSGSLRLLANYSPAQKHDHFDLVFGNGSVMRLTDPRRFGAVLWAQGEDHPLLCHLGVEPLTEQFDGEWLYSRSRNRKASIKQFLMDSRIVVGVGNIYANEALFRSKISPVKPSGEISLKNCQILAGEIKRTLLEAIRAGGSSLRDFVDTSGKPGYFQQSYYVYGRKNEPCRVCGELIVQIRQGQRSSFYCPRCQK